MPRWAQIALVQSLLLLLAGSLVHVPFHSIAPGETRDVLAEIEIRGTRTYESAGQLLITTASVSPGPLTVWESLAVWLSPEHATVPRPFLVPPDSSDADVDIENRHDIEESKIVATVAAFRALGHEVPVVDGANVVTVLEDAPATDLLRQGDRIVAIDGTERRTPRAVSNAIADRTPGDPITLEIIRQGERRVIEAETTGADGRALLGVTLGPAYDFPTEVTIDSGDIVGPSAGLVFALSIADAVTRDDLTRGHIVGVTGTIALDDDGRGVVGQIGAVGEKVRGAVRDGATVFIAPRGAEAREARAIAPDGVHVIGVGTLAQAIRALRRLDPA